MINNPLNINQNQNFQKRIEKVQKEELNLYKKAKISRELVINFPNKNKVPFWGKIASYILVKVGAVLDIKYIDNK